jgi:hypothetical protein
MSRRRQRSSRPSTSEPFSAGAAFETIEEWPDGDWAVRRLTGSASTKPYRCPGCQQLIPTATPHLVAWPVEGSVLTGGPEERRHWHNACWGARDRRGPR